MKRALNGLGAALCAGALLATVGCDSIRDYSVSTYQGVMPVNDFRPSGAVAISKTNADMPRPSIPTPAPEAAPAASASPSTDSTATKPADSTK
jgi:hypothetical protein